MSLGKLYAGFLADKKRDTPISFPMQQRILNYYQSRKGGEGLFILAHYEHLDSRIDQQIGASTNISVLHAWASRTGRTGEELTTRLLQDTRTKAVLPLAKQMGLPDSLYGDLGNLNSHAIDVALAGNVSVPLSLRIEKMRKIVTRIPRGEKTTLDISALCVASDYVDSSDQQALYQAVATTTLWGGYVRECLRTDFMRPQDIQHIIDNLDVIHKCGQGTTLETERTKDVIGILDLLNRYAKPISGTQREKLISFAKQMLANNSDKSPTLVSTLEATVARLQQYDSATEQMLIDFEAETNPETATKIGEHLTTKCGKGTHLSYRFLVLVAAHPYLSAKIGLALFGDMSHTQRATFVTNLDLRNEMAALVDIFDTHTLLAEYRFSNDLFGRVHNKRELLETLLKRRAETGQLLDDWMLISDVLENNLDVAIRAIRWNMLAEKASTVPGLSSLIEQIILRELADNQEHWEAFIALGEDYGGSLDMLLTAVHELCK